AGIGKDCWGDELSPEFKAHLGRSIDVRPAPRGEGAYITVRSPAAAELLATMLCSRVAPPVTGLCVDWPGAQSNLEGSRMLSLLAESVGSEGIRSIQLVGSGPVSPEFWVLLAKAPKLEELSIRPHSEE